MTAITRFRGDTYADEITVKSAATGLPITVTGYSFVMTLDSKRDPTSSDTNLYQVIGNIIDPGAGRVEFVPTAAQANRVGIFYYDIQMIDAAGRIRTIALDAYTYTQDVSK